MTADDALSQYATSGHLNPVALTRNALLISITGGAASLRTTVGTGAIASPPKVRPVDAPERTGVPPEAINGGIGDLWAHEGPARPWGHTIQKHVGQSVADLRQRLSAEPRRGAVSTFTDQVTAERAINDVLRLNPTDYAALVSGAEESIQLEGRLRYYCGTVLRRGGVPRPGRNVLVVLVLSHGNVVVRTAFVE